MSTSQINIFLFISWDRLHPDFFKEAFFSQHVPAFFALPPCLVSIKHRQRCPTEKVTETGNVPWICSVRHRETEWVMFDCCSASINTMFNSFSKKKTYLLLGEPSSLELSRSNLLCCSSISGSPLVNLIT